MEDEIEVRVGTFFGLDRFLSFFENLRLQFNIARLVNAVNVSERGGERVSADAAQFFFNEKHIFGRGVEFCARFAGDAVLFAADNSRFNFENDLRLRASFEKTLRDLDVFLVGKSRSVEHM